ncbi:MAG: ABC transporter substrate-binding protein [Thermomicrobiales bacterium]
MTDHKVDELITEAKTLRYSRRTVMRRAAALGLSVPAVTAALQTSGYAAPNQVRRFRAAPAFLQGTKLHILGASYFVVAGETRYREQMAEFGAQNGIEVTLDLVAWPDLQARIAAAIQAQAGVDIIQLWDPWPYLYQENLVDVNDIAGPHGEAHGGYYDWVVKTASVDGSWHSIPYGTSSSAYVYRPSHFAQVGYDAFPDTWDDLFAAGKALKEAGLPPLGQALGHSLGDPPSFTYAYMWANGAMEVEEDGTTIAFNKPEFVDGMNRFIQGWKDGFDTTGTAWDDSTNNTAYLSGELSATLNGSSIYIAAGKSEADGGNPEIYEDTNHADFPQGPAGRFTNIGAQSWGITTFSENIAGAKAFLDFWYSDHQLTSWYNANSGYYIPATSGFADLPVYTENPKLAPYLNLVNYGRNKGYAGPSDESAALSYSRFVVIDTFARAVEDGDAQGAIEWGADQLERIYGE